MKDEIRTQHDLGKLEKWSEIMNTRREKINSLNIKCGRVGWKQFGRGKKCKIGIEEKVNIYFKIHAVCG